jgi:CubicO group peptidase (beta-lactamase class C family)
MPKKIRQLISCGVFLGFTSCPLPTSSADLVGLETSIKRISLKSAIPGTYVAIVSRDRILYSRATGDYVKKRRREGNNQQFSPYLRLGSITKTFNALLALRLAAAGQLSLRTPCPWQLALCPQSAHDKRRTAVSVEQLLEHTSGMTDLTAKEFASAVPLSLAAAAQVAPASRLMHWPPGSYSVYSNNNAAAFSALLLFHTHTAYENLLNTQVFLPLGLTSATFSRSQAVIAALPPGHAGDGNTVLPYWHMIYPAFGGLNLRAQDTLAVLQMFLNRGRHRGQRFISETALQRMEHPQTSLGARAGLSYGYGLGLYQWYRRGVLFFGHDGDADGYLARFGYAPALGLGYVVAINSDNRPGLQTLRLALETRLVGTGETPPPRYPLDRSALQRVAGQYVAETARFPWRPSTAAKIRVVQSAESLFTLNAAGRRRELIPVSSRSFRRAEDGGPTIILVQLGEAIYLLGDDLGNYRKAP